MSKTQWMINKCIEYNKKLAFNVFMASNQIYQNILDNNLDALYIYIYKICNIDLQPYNYSIIFRKTEKGYYHNWHLDGRRVFKNRKGIVCPSDPNNTSEYILHNILETIPKYSLLYYNSNYNIDFTGGTIEFINNKIIQPKKNLCILFDSNLGHRVNNQNSGIRECILILFFEKI